jgi:hypothetical protein
MDETSARTGKSQKLLWIYIGSHFFAAVVCFFVAVTWVNSFVLYLFLFLLGTLLLHSFRTSFNFTPEDALLKQVSLVLVTGLILIAGATAAIFLASRAEKTAFGPKNITIRQARHIAIQTLTTTGYGDHPPSAPLALDTCDALMVFGVLYLGVSISVAVGKVANPERNSNNESND